MTTATLMSRAVVPSPMGDLVAMARGDQLIALGWANDFGRITAHINRHLGQWAPDGSQAPPVILRALTDYFSGDIHALRGLDVDPPGTPFQQQVWSTLRTIPPGQVWSYKQLAEAVGRPRAFRAVAQANGANPIPLVIPCHRVIAADGSIGGFSCGLDRKLWLLEHEGVVLES